MLGQLEPELAGRLVAELPVGKLVVGLPVGRLAVGQLVRILVAQLLAGLGFLAVLVLVGQELVAL